MDTFTKAMETLRNGFDAATDFRMSEVSRLRSEAHGFMQDTREHFEQMADELHKTLNKNEADRHKMEAERARERFDMAHRRHDDVQRQMKEFHEDFVGGAKAFHTH